MNKKPMKEMSDQQISFLMECMNENFAHARHVENERLTFSSIYMALAGASLAFVLGNDPLVSALVSGLMLILGFINMTLTKRWDRVFGAHRRRGYEVYKLLDDYFRSTGETYADLTSNPADLIAGVNSRMKYFNRSGNYIHTKTLFFTFNMIIQLVMMVSFFYYSVLLLNR